MNRRFASVWLHQLLPDRMILRQPSLRERPFVLAAPLHGRLVVTAVSSVAIAQGVSPGMGVADAKAFIPGLEILDDRPGLADELLETLGLWCIRYTPWVAVDPPDGLLLDISGCAHLWGGEESYIGDLRNQLQQRYGFQSYIGVADTIGTAWAIARFGQQKSRWVGKGASVPALQDLPPEALRVEPAVADRLHKLGLRTIGSFMKMPAEVLRRRFGEGLVQRLRQALGEEEEFRLPLKPVPPYTERLPCLEPVRTAEVIETNIQHLLELLCGRLAREGKGLREAVLEGYRVDGKIVKVAINTSRPTGSAAHLLKLFVLKLPEIEPGLGIESWVLEAFRVEAIDPVQEALWEETIGLEDAGLAELIDRLKSREGTLGIYRFLPDQHYWPERSIKIARSLKARMDFTWSVERPRPIRLLPKPEPVEVTAPIPDYPPMVFRYKGQTHTIKKADGPERIEREWWMDEGEHRDYYCVEDEVGQRYWLFRSGHYGDGLSGQWYLHGFFA